MKVFPLQFAKLKRKSSFPFMIEITTNRVSSFNRQYLQSRGIFNNVHQKFKLSCCSRKSCNMQILQITMWTPWKALDRLRDTMCECQNNKLHKFDKGNMLKQRHNSWFDNQSSCAKRGYEIGVYSHAFLTFQQKEQPSEKRSKIECCQLLYDQLTASNVNISTAKICMDFPSTKASEK